MVHFRASVPVGSSSAAITAGLTAGLLNPLATRIGIMRRTQVAYTAREMRLALIDADHLYRTLCSWSEPAHPHHALFHAVAELPETMLPMEFVTVLAHLDALPSQFLGLFVHLYGVSPAMVDDSLIASAAYTLRQAFAPEKAEDDATLPVGRPVPACPPEWDFVAALQGKHRYVVAAFQPSNMPSPAVRALAAGLGVIAADAS